MPGWRNLEIILIKPTGYQPIHDPNWWPPLESEFEIDEWEEKVRELARIRIRNSNKKEERNDQAS